MPFNRAGYRVSCFAEAGPYGAGLNPYIHSSRDTISQLDVAQIQQFGRMCVGLVIELAQYEEPVNQGLDFR